LARIVDDERFIASWVDVALAITERHVLEHAFDRFDRTPFRSISHDCVCKPPRRS